MNIPSCTICSFRRGENIARNHDSGVRRQIKTKFPAADSIFSVAVSSSFILSLWTSFTGGTINLDGILYISVAERLQQGNFSFAAELYSWFFYPLCIAGISRVSGLGLETAAFLLTACFSALLTYAFLACVRLFEDSERVLVWAALIIVFHPVLMEDRCEIIRDHGYWGFYLLAIFFVLRFSLSGRWRDVLGWWGSMVLATMFRVEGLLFLFLLPLSLLWQRRPWSQRWRFFAKAQLLNLVFFISAMIFLSWTKNPGAQLLEWGRLGDILVLGEKFYIALNGGLAQKTEMLEKVLYPYSQDYAGAVLLLIPLVIFLHKLLATLTPVYVGVFCCRPWRYLRRLNHDLLIVLIWTMLLNTLILLVFVFSEYYLQRRFAYPLGIVVLLLLPFVFDSYFLLWRGGEKVFPLKRCILYPAAVFLVLQSLGGFLHWPGNSDYFVKEAGLWLKDNLPAQTSLYSNNPKLYYYSGRMERYWEERPLRFEFSSALLQEKPWPDKAYIALWVSRHFPGTTAEISRDLERKPVKVFSNRRHDRVIIYAAG
ncbi:MAG: hypothetical protein JXR89_08970 [Deltaproteobacteria bacterium]|nr:hypothetical protein [Deltaproteobacteria bacterium]